MILHLILDEKVIPRMMDSFDDIYSGNIYLCVTRKKRFEDLRFLQKRDNLYLLYEGKLNEIPWKKVTKVCIHFLDLHKIIALKYLKWFKGLKPKATIWFTWGGDYYDLAEKKGFNVYSSNNSRKKNPYNSLWKKIFWVTYGYIERILKRPFLKYEVNYLGASRAEYDLICDTVNFKCLKGRLDMHYYAIEDVLKNLLDTNVHGHDIIIGNSASTFNNHEYIYNFFKDLPCEGAKIYVPLNYGAYPEYRQKITMLYKTLPNSIIISDFLNLDIYNEILCGCSTFIYGHFRQAGWGNIIIALYLGGKVYLPKGSQNFKNFIDFGFKVFSLEEIEKTFRVQLTSEEKEHNRYLALELFSKEKNKDNIKYICYNRL